MKKKLFKATFTVVFTFVLGIVVYTSYNQKITLSDLAIENMEALAQGEGSKVHCCPDPGDQCVLSSGDILHDQDECER